MQALPIGLMVRFDAVKVNVKNDKV